MKKFVSLVGKDALFSFHCPRFAGGEWPTPWPVSAGEGQERRHGTFLFSFPFFYLPALLLLPPALLILFHPPRLLAPQQVAGGCQVLQQVREEPRSMRWHVQSHVASWSRERRPRSLSLSLSLVKENRSECIRRVTAFEGKEGEDFRGGNKKDENGRLGF